MNLKPFTPKQSLNKAYLKEKISRADIELFKVYFADLLEKINDKGDEEHLKSLVSDFLKLTYYNGSQNQINPVGKNDLVIHTGKSPSDPYGVILEVKSPSNKSEMLSAGKTNVKALHELVLYYLDERITRNRNELKQLIITNIYEWYIIDANEFDKKIYRSPAIKKLYDLKKSDGKDNPWFYDELKKYFDAHADQSLDVTFFDIRDYKKIVSNTDKQDDKGLIALYKILSPVHLLKLPFANDSNTLQPKFYSELLHIIGLYEYKEGSKKLISRKKEGERNAGSLLENAIVQLDSHDKISRLDKPSQYGDKYEDRLYNVALELVITWINRILFLKLLEAQLINYHKGDRSYTFLNKDKLKDFDDLDKLFFRVLAKRANERDEAIQQLFGKVPYLNSSLFEPTELEHQTLFINNLENAVVLPSINATVLKDANGKPLKGGLETLDYLFAFLNAYDFSSEGAEEIQEDNKQLINASVLGLIFEKINGYKDGSFFTPGFITMYMCRETIRRAVVQKFNEARGWDCKEYSELYDKITDKKEANGIINSLKICDPAVGSGHFLVSALNEIIAIKSDLRVLVDKDGRSLHYYGVEVVNDELIITDENGDIFEYNPNSKESQRVQETLFHEKQTIIENCLFGVDINPNSVKICRLRLWIELLKNAYYKEGVTLSPSKGGAEAGPPLLRQAQHDNARELETLPNIDINIKTGNSLISRFALDADLKQALKKSKYSIDAYKIAVQTYRESTNKVQKHEMERLIASIKSDFRTEISANDPKIKLLDRRGKELYNKYQSDQLFSQKLSAAQMKDRKKLEDEVNKLSKEIAEIKDNKIYEDAFEWRFEFPEVLNNEGDFLGFDLIIGNPPYIYRNFDFSKSKKYFSTFKSYEGNFDLYKFFIERIYIILKQKGCASFIVPNTFLSAKTYSKLRAFFISHYEINELYDLGLNVFEGVTVENIIFVITKPIVPDNASTSVKIDRQSQKNILMPEKKYSIPIQAIYDKEKTFNIYFETITEALINKLRNRTIKLEEIAYCTVGINTGYIKEQLVAEYKVDETYHKLISGRDIGVYTISWKNEWIKYDKEFVDSFGELGRTLPPEYIFTKDKILVQRTRRGLERKLVCTLDTDQYYNLNRVSNIVLNDATYSIKYVLALLNSKVLDYYFNKVFNEYEVKPLHLSALPIKIATPKQQDQIVGIVDEVLWKKKLINKKDTTFLETQIDQLVYQLYGLTEEEIKIVEGA